MDVYILIILIVILSVLLLISICALIIYTGIFIDINVGAGKPPVETLKVFYKAGEGSYKDVGPACCDVTSIAPSNTSFSIYYDDPNKSPSQERWAVGAFVDDTSYDIEELKTAFLKEGYKPFTFPKVQNVVKTSFPYTNPFSIAIGNYKVYPHLSHYIKEKRLCAHPWIEIYEGETIHYMVPLSMQKEFYVPEVLPKASPQKVKQPSRKSNKPRPDEGVECENDQDDMQGLVNEHCAPIVAVEHSYATSSHDKKVTCQNKSNDQSEAVVNSAGEQVDQSEPNDIHTKRSKSVNVLSDKNTNTARLRSTSSISHTVHRDEGFLKKLNQGATAAALLANGGQGHTTDDSCEEESGINSSASSMSSTTDTIESSFLSSEYSYSSVDTCVSRDMSRLSCDDHDSSL